MWSSRGWPGRLPRYTPTGRYELIDGSPSTRALSESLGQPPAAGAPSPGLSGSRSGVVLLLEWRNFRALLLASSGAADRNPFEWLQAQEPQVALLSVALSDRRARPALEVL